jgi:CheY-like chemotaxis protein
MAKEPPLPALALGPRFDFGRVMELNGKSKQSSHCWCPGLRDALTEQLSLHEEFEAVAAENGSKGVQAAKAGQIDLVIMDVGLPDIDGREAMRILRKNGFKAPIIMLTGHDADSDTILGLESGANDYVTKPRSVMAQSDLEAAGLRSGRLTRVGCQSD